jgi:hypothetical protein
MNWEGIVKKKEQRIKKNLKKKQSKLWRVMIRKRLCDYNLFFLNSTKDTRVYTTTVGIVGIHKIYKKYIQVYRVSTIYLILIQTADRETKFYFIFNKYTEICQVHFLHIYLFIAFVNEMEVVHIGNNTGVRLNRD